jgi:hypothetical protein
MKKIILLFLTTILVLPFALSLNINVEKLSSDEVMILGLDQPATFNLNITNNGATEYVTFYTFFSPDIYPRGTVKLEALQSQEVDLKIYPPEKIKLGRYIFNYFIRADNGEENTQSLMVNVINLNDVFEIGSEEFNPEDNTIQIYIQNLFSFDFEKIDLRISSAFFNLDKEISLGPNERQNFTISIDKEDTKKLMAGYYTIDGNIQIGEKETKVEGILKFVEKNILTTNKKTFGFIINTNTIEKTNEGNVPVETETVIKKNIISRLFTTFNPEPSTVEREGFLIYYTWKNTINPGESLTINVKTNWILPFALIILIVLVVVIVKTSSHKPLILDKKVQFMNSKGSEFALKVSLTLEAKEFIEKITVIDRLPYLTRIYEKFEGEKPARVDEKNKKIEWNFERMHAGEKRTLSYVIYSKIGVVGKFALPTSTAMYEKNGKVQESHSNQAFFMIEPRTRKDMEE